MLKYVRKKYICTTCIYMKRKFYGNRTNSLEEEKLNRFHYYFDTNKQSTYFFFSFVKTNKIHIIF